MTVESIKAAIVELSSVEKTSLASWLLQQDMAEWDKQIEEDFSPGGNGMTMLAEAEADFRAGRVKPLDEFLVEVKAIRNAPKSQS